MSDRKVYDYARGKYNVLETVRDTVRVPEARSIQTVSVVAVAALGAGLAAAFVLAAFMFR